MHPKAEPRDALDPSFQAAAQLHSRTGSAPGIDSQQWPKSLMATGVTTIIRSTPGELRHVLVFVHLSLSLSLPCSLVQFFVHFKQLDSLTKKGWHTTFPKHLDIQAPNGNQVLPPGHPKHWKKANGDAKGHKSSGTRHLTKVQQNLGFQ